MNEFGGWGAFSCVLGFGFRGLILGLLGDDDDWICFGCVVGAVGGFHL